MALGMCFFKIGFLSNLKFHGFSKKLNLELDFLRIEMKKNLKEYPRLPFQVFRLFLIIMAIYQVSFQRKLQILFGLFFLMSSQFVFAQSEWVEFKAFRQAAPREFKYHTPSKFSVVNGTLSISFQSANGYLFEINGIPKSALKCGKVLSPSQFSVLVIDHLMDKKFVSKANDYHNSIGIICMEKGFYKLIFRGKLYNGEQKISCNATLLGKIKSEKQYQTN